MDTEPNIAAAPPVFMVSHTLTGWNVAQILITVGVGQMIVGQPEGNAVSTGLRVTWTNTLAFSPQAAKHLTSQLTEAVERYERQYGPIPQDPAMQPVRTQDNVIPIGAPFDRADPPLFDSDLQGRAGLVPDPAPPAEHEPA